MFSLSASQSHKKQSVSSTRTYLSSNFRGKHARQQGDDNTAPDVIYARILKRLKRLKLTNGGGGVPLSKDGLPIPTTFKPPQNLPQHLKGHITQCPSKLDLLDSRALLLFYSAATKSQVAYAKATHTWVS